MLAMSMAAASAFMPVSLLTPIAADLQVSEGQAGQGLSVSGLFALLTSLVIAAVVSVVRTIWGNQGGQVDPKAVARLREHTDPASPTPIVLHMC